jgi:hypothetical protein
MNPATSLKAARANPSTASVTGTSKGSAPAQTFFSVLRNVAQRMLGSAKQNVLPGDAALAAKPEGKNTAAKSKTKIVREEAKQLEQHKTPVPSFAPIVAEQAVPMIPQVFPPQSKPAIVVPRNEPAALSEQKPEKMPPLNAPSMRPASHATAPATPQTVKTPSITPAAPTRISDGKPAATIPVSNAVPSVTAPHAKTSGSAAKESASRVDVPANHTRTESTGKISVPEAPKPVMQATKAETIAHSEPQSRAAAKIQPITQAPVEPQKLAAVRQGETNTNPDSATNIFRQIEAFWQRHLKTAVTAFTSEKVKALKPDSSKPTATPLPEAPTSKMESVQPAPLQSEKKVAQPQGKVDISPPTQAKAATANIAVPAFVAASSAVKADLKPVVSSDHKPATPQMELPKAMESDQHLPASGKAEQPKPVSPVAEIVAPSLALPKTVAGQELRAVNKAGGKESVQPGSIAKTASSPVAQPLVAARKDTRPAMKTNRKDAAKPVAPLQSPLRAKPPAMTPDVDVPMAHAEERHGGEVRQAAQTSMVMPEETKKNAAPRSFWGVKVVREERTPSPDQNHRSTPTDKSAATQDTTKPASRTDNSGRGPVFAPMAMPERIPETQIARAQDTAAAKPGSKPPAAPQPERAHESLTTSSNEELATTSMTTSAAKDSPNLPLQNVATPRIHFTIEQIKELQEMVTRSLQTARTLTDGAREAVFNWNHENLGPLAFRIVTHKDEVEIRIDSDRKDVADALKEGRGTVERMIADIGLKVERFEVKVRPESPFQDMANQTNERNNPERGRQAHGDEAMGASLSLDADEEEPASLPDNASADRVWVA